MKKLLSTIFIITALSCGFTAVCFASGAISNMKQLQVTPDQLIPDNNSWNGTVYNGKMVVLNGSTIALNRNYINNIVGYTGINPAKVRITLGEFELFGCPNLPANLYGKIGRVPYKTFNDQRKVWVKTTASTMSSPALFEETGIIINPANFESINSYYESIFIEKRPCYNNVNGMYPRYRAVFSLKMSAAEYAAFKADVQGSSFAPIFSEVVVVPGNGGM